MARLHGINAFVVKYYEKLYRFTVIMFVCIFPLCLLKQLICYISIVGPQIPPFKLNNFYLLHFHQISIHSHFCLSVVQFQLSAKTHSTSDISDKKQRPILLTCCTVTRYRELCGLGLGKSKAEEDTFHTVIQHNHRAKWNQPKSMGTAIKMGRWLRLSAVARRRLSEWVRAEGGRERKKAVVKGYVGAKMALQ